jgi:thiol-disulfide isomerase/thioredoxin
MATPSSMLPLGTAAPDFALPDTISGRTLSLRALAGVRGTLVMFICNHCPYVQHVIPQLLQLAAEFQPAGISFVAISSNDAQTYPEDGPAAMTAEAARHGYPFPYLYDASQEVAKAYDAACTPDFYLFDAELKLVYRGRLDDSTPRNSRPLSGADLRAALGALVTAAPIPADQQPSLGCSIKWVHA